MRLLSVTVLGTALVAAGLLAPAAGEATTSQQDGLTVRPGTVRAGQKVELSVPGCGPGRHRASSDAFDGRALLDDSDGTATIKDGVRPDTYRVSVDCGRRKVTGKVRVAGRLGWPALLPDLRNGR
ncbi:hypothetical protein [Actinomadura verrucosospora]|uniref:Transglycosylase SLT domain protein n=1 Tax=Actinomadura verrucosospora TaxID=46165 RepID=A0A7D3VTL7_ACTVE|nr:hypothetical protein [Actinomadura verrucosospora]QKG22720.1 transglycosylase SLT domain protein [Actinomadura verrucosospora]